MLNEKEMTKDVTYWIVRSGHTKNCLEAKLKPMQEFFQECSTLHQESKRSKDILEN